MGKFEVTIRKNGDYQFNLKASNGQVILSSQGYKSKVSCIESVRKNSQSIERFDKKVAANGKPYFNLMATNGQVIGSSQMYASEATCANGIASVMKNAPDAVIVEIPAEE